MSIKFEKRRKIFHLSTKNYSYYIHVNKHNYLIHLYDGPYLNDISKERVSERYMERYAYVDNGTEVMDEDYYFSMFASKFECAPYGKLDKRNPFAIVNDESNIDITNFLYVSHKIYKGFDKKFKMPHPRFNTDECQTLEILTKDETRDIYLTLYYTISEKYDCMVRHSKIENRTKTDIFVNKFSAMELDLDNDDYEIVCYHGSWGWERQQEVIKLNHSLTEISDNHGGRGFYFGPSLLLKKTNADLDSGEVYGFSCIYSGDFSYQFKVDEISQTRIIAGYNSENFSYCLSENESLYSFCVLQVFSSDGINRISNVFHDVTRDLIMPQKFAKAERPILLNSWEAMFMDFTTEKIISFIDKAKELDIDLVVLDDGWFGHRNDDKSSLGDWFVNKEKIDLKRVADYCHLKKMKFGLWIEPEMISPDSQLYKEHPEYALHPKKCTNPTLQRHQLVLDLVNENARKHVLTQIFSILDSIDIDYVKWDFNRFLSEAYSECLESKHKKETYHKFVLGTYDMLEQFTSRYPNILLETCASGGGRFDLGMLYYSPQIWGSDETDIAMRAYINYTTNVFYPLSSIGTHISARKIGSIQDKACLAFFGTFGYEQDVNKLNEEDCKKIKEMNDLFRKYHHIVTLGDYYAIYNPYETNYVSWNCVTKDKKQCVVYFMNMNKEQTRARFIKIKGLDKTKFYFNSLTNDIYLGSFYENVGLNISCELNAYTSMLFVLQEVNSTLSKIYRKKHQTDSGKREKIL